MRHPFVVMLALACGIDALAADTLSVGPSAADDFAEIQPAIDAAQPGDVLVVDGTGFPYAAFHADKPLAIVSKTTARPRVWSLGAEPCVVTDIGAGERFLLANISFLGLDGVRVQNCDGLVVIHHAHMDVGTSRIRDAAAFLLTDTSQEPAVLGQKTWPQFHFKNAAAWLVESSSQPPSPLSALASPIESVTHELEGSSLAYFGSVVDGADFASGSGTGGGTALRATSSTVALRRSHFSGGDGGTRFAGVAAELLGASTLRLGPGSTLSGGVGLDAVLQEDVSLSADSSLIAEAFAPPALATFPHALAQGDVTITLYGEAGTTGQALASANVSAPWTHPSIEGALFLDRASLVSLGAVQLDASGTASLVVPIESGPVFQGGVAVLQWIANDAAGPVASNPSLVYRTPSAGG